MDTTLRDGEQTPNVSYTPAEKLQLARMLLSDLEVDRIEIASTRVSAGELEAAQAITKWARKASAIQRIEMLGYTDGRKSVDWICEAGGKVLNLLTKGSERHCREQLGLSPEEHRERVSETVRYARRKRLTVNVYLEDWSSGVRDSFDYVFAMVQQLRELRVARVYLADTLGVLAPEDVTRFVGLMTATFPAVDFEYHGHNDYGLATANCLAAIHAGARGVHTSVNGMGERAGNTSLAEVVAAIHDHTDARTGVREDRLSALSSMVATFSGKEIAANTPIVGRDVYTQTAGIHADGDAKGDLYATRLAPGRFGGARRYALGKLSGKASLDHNLAKLGIELPDADRDLVLQRIVELGDKKHIVTPDDLPYLIADVLKTPDDQRVQIESWEVDVSSKEPPRARVALAYRGLVEKAESSGDGGYDAFMNALKKAAKPLEIEVPVLADYRVRIPPGGRTGALVETTVTWRLETAAAAGAKSTVETFTTLGVDSDQLAAAIIATEKMLNAVVTRRAGPRPAASTSGRSGARERRRPRGEAKESGAR
ncbi:MAG: 2-isopropylmalate synthase [Spirochaetaceae bacterium]|nr:2-isopropylmalate synthase [Spirochaetaceae bacterium]HPG26996.1 alpha-isopropylmalate synthase regulatory domain-containing protein [Myxococcota bacterium]